MELDGWGSISRDLGDMLREQATPSSAKFPAPEQSEEPRASGPGVRGASGLGPRSHLL